MGVGVSFLCSLLVLPSFPLKSLQGRTRVRGRLLWPGTI